MMRSLHQTGTRNGSRPSWLRLLALVCLLVISVASTAQVCHTHTALLPIERGSHQNLPDHCPLCVAMHSALPAAMQVAHGEVRTGQRLVALAAPGWTGRIRVADLQTRPPPQG